MLSYCGLKCDECPVYIATITNDESMKEAISIEYSSEEYIMAKEDIHCQGCHHQQNQCKMCLDCPIRMCAMQYDVTTCAECVEYPCSLIEDYVPEGSENRMRLDELLYQKKSQC